MLKLSHPLPVVEFGTIIGLFHLGKKKPVAPSLLVEFYGI
jgi:hypothetical protein